MTSLSEKTCTKCGETKSVRHFWRRAKARDGLSSACIVCRRAERKRRDGRPEVKATRRVNDAEWREHNRERTQAYDRLRHAIKLGKIKKPSVCPRCKVSKHVVADYIRTKPPIEFVWLCRQCISDRFWRRS